MREDRELRILRTAEYIVAGKATVRQAARVFQVSKSTVHKDMGGALRALDASLFREVRAVLDQNRAERHLRGGLATQKKYKNVKKVYFMSKK